MVLSSAPQNRVLVRLSDVTQELTVGLGNATASVRTLTDVSLVVRARELVVLSGSRGAGERAVLAVVAGDRRGVLGTCEVANDARIRIMRIGARSARALAEEWQHANAHEVLTPHRVARPDVFLLDVVPDVDDDPLLRGASTRTSRVREAHADSRGSPQPASSADPHTRTYVPKPWDEKNRSALRAWAEVCRMRDGAVIMAAGDAVGRGLFDAALAHMNARAAADPGAGPRAPTGVVREVFLAESEVRVVAMHSGRLASTVRLHPYDLPA